METVNIHEAKTHFSKLVARAQKGESVLIAKAGHPVERIVPVEPQSPAPKLPPFGFMKGLAQIPKDIKKPFTRDIEEMFYGTE